MDGLRGVAFLLVFFFHAGWLGLGWIGVPLFFAASGFLISGSVARARAASTRPLRRFLAWRIARIVPLYAMWLGMGVAVDVAFAEVEPLEIGTLLTWTYNLARPWVDATDSRVAHLWSLSAEEQCYGLAAVILLLVPEGRSRRIGWGLALAAAAGARVALWYGLDDLDPYTRGDAIYQVTQLECFVAGVFVWQNPARWSRWYRSALVGLVLLCFLHQTRSLGWPTTWWQLTSSGLPFAGTAAGQPLWSYPLLALVFGTWVGRAVLTPPRWLAHRGLTHLGRRCFALYVFHWPILASLDGLLGDSPPLLLEVVRVLVALALTVWLAEVSWRWVEAPSRRRIRTATRHW